MKKTKPCSYSLKNVIIAINVQNVQYCSVDMARFTFRKLNPSSATSHMQKYV